jgi:hypothetical protein
MELNINQLVRSAVILVVGLPVTVAIASQAIPEKAETTEVEQLKTNLGLPCLKFAMTKVDSKGERESKDEIDEVLGVAGADYREVCKWALG